MVEKYFEGETSTAEEKWLKVALLKADKTDPMVEEALAVMGYAYSAHIADSDAADPQNAVLESKRKSHTRHYLRIASVAAAIIAVVFTFSWIWNPSANEDETEYFAYVEGVRIENEIAIRNLISIQLEEMGEGSAEINNQIQSDFQDLKNAMEL